MPTAPEPLNAILEMTADRKGPVGAAFVDIDPKTGKVWARGAMTTLLPPRPIVWKVIPDQKITLDQVEIEIFLRHENSRMPVRYRIELAIPRTDVEAAVETLSVDQRPATTLRKWIRNWFDTWANEGMRRWTRPELEERILHERSEVIRRIRDDARHELHIRLDLYLDLMEKVVTDISVSSGPFLVRPHDAKVDISIDIDLTLIRPPEASIEAGGPTTANEWAERIRQLVRQAFDRRITVHCWAFDPKTAESILRETIAPDAKRYGRVIGKFVPTFPEPPFPREVKVEARVPWRSVSGKDVSFNVEARLTVEEEGAGLYQSRGCPDLQRWIGERVERLLKAQLFGRDYIDLTPAVIEGLNNRLQQELGLEAHQIGQSVETVTSDPDLPIQKWRTGVRLRCAKQSYSTRVPKFTAEIDMEIEVVAEHLRGLKPYFDRGEDAERRVMEAAQEAARTLFRSVDPVAYIKGFDHPALSRDGESTPSIHERLRHAVEEHLYRHFALKTTRFTASRHDSAYNEILDALTTAGNQRASFSLDSRGGLEDTLILRGEVEFEVTNYIADERIVRVIHGKFSPKRVVEEVVLLVEGALDKLDPRELVRIFSTPDQSARKEQAELEKQLGDGIVTAMLAEFGLTLAIKMVRFGDSSAIRAQARELEDEIANHRIKDRLTRRISVNEELAAFARDKKVYEERRRVAFETGDPELLRDLEVFKNDLDKREIELRERGAGSSLPPPAPKPQIGSRPDSSSDEF